MNIQNFFFNNFFKIIKKSLLALSLFGWSGQLMPLLSAANPQDSVTIPSDCQDLLDEVITHYFIDISPSEIISAPLPGGHSTNGVTNLLITTDAHRYALRMKPHESLALLQREQFAMEEAARVGISPRIYYVTSDHRAILMDYVAENTLTVAEANQRNSCIQIAQAIRKIHAIQKNPYFVNSENDDLENIFSEICHHPKISAQLHEAIGIMRNCNEKLKSFDSYQVSNHGDLNSRNIFLTEKGPQFIDWEYANWADPFEDLSYFCLRHNYDQKTEFIFLESYLGRVPSLVELERYYIIKKKVFSQLCIYFHYFSLKFNPNGVDVSTISSRCWSYYMIAYSERRDEIPLNQLYYELASCALQLAKEIDESKSFVRAPFKNH